MPPVDWIASIVAAISVFVLGGLWYSPVLFAKAWQQDTGLSDEALAAANKGKIFGLSFILCLAAAVVFSMFLGPDPSVQFAVGAGAAAVCGVTRIAPKSISECRVATATGSRADRSTTGGAAATKS